MKIKMTQTARGSYDGAHVETYEQDVEYVVGSFYMPHALADVFLQDGRAVEVKGEPQTSPTESKITGPDQKKGK